MRGAWRGGTALAALGLWWAAPAWAADPRGSDAGKPRTEQTRDKPRPPPKAEELSPEDREVVENLELLENLETGAQFELLNELSRKDDR